MKTKMNKALRTALALLLCMGFFLVSTQAFANEPSVAPPTVHAEIIGSLLRIQTTAGFFSVEAVYINGRRFNHRVDSALVIDISQYIASGDTLAIHAVDFAGNESSTVLLTPPPTALPPQPNNITPDGQGEMIDHLTSYDNIEFFTINSRAGNVFYLVIDHTRHGDNVYFLNSVTEWDLINLAENAEVPRPPLFATPPPIVIEEEPEPTPTPEPEPPPQRGGCIGGSFIFFALLGIAGTGALIYFLFIKKKPVQSGGSENDDGGNEQDDYDELEDEFPEYYDEQGDEE